ncbi:MAG: Fe-S protein assembly co-chaperone HscB [Blastocatellia bacterium AA13]|nr:MAG: Fe-S protein assembly co-chaperone HscB [Blastocatellia bacterium AA13]
MSRLHAAAVNRSLRNIGEWHYSATVSSLAAQTMRFKECDGWDAAATQPYFFGAGVLSQSMEQTLERGRCPNCGAVASSHFCSDCKRIQPVRSNVDYFEFLELPRLLAIDEAALEKTFYSLSRALHPDYFMGASDEERQASLARSSILNDAYRTLRDPIRRVQYLLKLEGYKEAEKRAPADLLEEVFELNMQIEELKNAKKAGDEQEAQEARESLEEALTGLKQRLAGIDDTIFSLFSQWDAAIAAENGSGKTVLDDISELLSNRSYIRSLIREIEEEF